MSKKDELIPAFLVEENPKPKPQPKVKKARVLPHRTGRPTSENATKETGCRPGETRFTTILEKKLVDETRKLAYWDRRTVKAVVTLALEDYIRDYKKKHGALKDIPER